jgi:endonuclease YncB( thermonuclease family)
MSSVPWSWPDSRVTRVIDGDSLTATLTKRSDLGFYITDVTSFPVRLRLNRINTPPAKTAEGHAAALYVTDLLISTSVPVLIETFKGYKYGSGDIPEWMAEITLPSGENLSDMLVSKGYAQYWDGTGPRPGG